MVSHVQPARYRRGRCQQQQRVSYTESMVAQGSSAGNRRLATTTSDNVSIEVTGGSEEEEDDAGAHLVITTTHPVNSGSIQHPPRPPLADSNSLAETPRVLLTPLSTTHLNIHLSTLDRVVRCNTLRSLDAHPSTHPPSSASSRPRPHHSPRLVVVSTFLFSADMAPMPSESSHLELMSESWWAALEGSRCLSRRPREERRSSPSRGGRIYLEDTRPHRED